MQLMILLAVSSLLTTSSGCAGMPTRPDSDACLINSQLLHEKCYNLLRDYNDAGGLLPGAKPHFHQFKDEAEMLAALNKKIDFDTDGWANLKAYVKQLRDALARKGD